MILLTNTISPVPDIIPLVLKAQRNRHGTTVKKSAGLLCRNRYFSAVYSVETGEFYQLSNCVGTGFGYRVET